jgi:hypothetical protein
LGKQALRTNQPHTIVFAALWIVASQCAHQFCESDDRQGLRDFSMRPSSYSREVELRDFAAVLRLYSDKIDL